MTETYCNMLISYSDSFLIHSLTVKLYEYPFRLSRTTYLIHAK